MPKKSSTQRAKGQTPSKGRPKSRRSAPNKPKQSKLDQLEAALRAPKGATIADLMALTGWQMHSVRGALAGALKKKRGLAIRSTKTDGERVYRAAGRS